MLQVLHAAQFHTQNSHRNHGAAASFSCCIINSVHKERCDFSCSCIQGNLYWKQQTQLSCFDSCVSPVLSLNLLMI